MSCPQWEERLNDFVDGSLETGAALEVERHLAACPGCRVEADGLRWVLRAAASSPRRIEPGRDLWPGIAEVLRRPLARRLWPGIAAAVLILAAAALTSTLRQSTPPGNATPSLATARQMDEAGDLREAEDEFRIATMKLMAALERKKAELPPRVIAELDENLRVVNQAIAETDAALARDPQNPRLGHLLTDIYETKMDLLSRAVRIPGAL